MAETVVKDFRKLPKKLIYVKVPIGIFKEFNRHRVRTRQARNRIIAESLCHHLGLDPSQYGIS